MPPGASWGRTSSSSRPWRPIQPGFRLLPAEQGSPTGPTTEAWVSSQGLVWNLPALHSRSTRLAVGPVVTDRLRLDLPEGARLDTVKLLTRREVLLFPAEAGKRYFLHAGGRIKHAPGNLADLPESSRAVYGRQPLALGPAEPDPQGLPVLVEGAALTRPWLSWLVGLAVAVMAVFAWRLLKAKG